MKRLLAVLVGSFVAAGVNASPKAESAAECGIAADMAVVARALAEEQVQPRQAGAIMARIYDVSDSDRGQELMRDILDAAYRKEMATTSQNFAEDLFMACIKSGGDMDTILGKRL